MNGIEEGAPRCAELTAAEAGELGLLARILADIPAADAAILGPGDDAAVLRAGSGSLVVTTDTMIEGPDFRTAWSSPADLAQKAVTSNLADVAAMGAAPTGLVIALALPGPTPVAWVEAFAAGLRTALAEAWPGCGVIGGDLGTARELVIAVTAFGDLEGRPPVVRSGARPGDVVALAGCAGESGAGLALLAEHADGADAVATRALRESSAGARRLIGRHVAPTAPLAAGRAAALAGATAMLDVSDGLLLDADRIAVASGVRIELDSALLAPLAAELERHLADAPALRDGGAADAALELVLRGGEDHALLATFPPGARLPEPFRPIGRVAPRGGDGGRGEGGGDAGERRLSLDGAPREPIGWDPFRA